MASSTWEADTLARVRLLLRSLVARTAGQPDRLECLLQEMLGSFVTDEVLAQSLAHECMIRIQAQTTPLETPRRSEAAAATAAATAPLVTTTASAVAAVAAQVVNPVLRGRRPSLRVQRPEDVRAATWADTAAPAAGYGIGAAEMVSFPPIDALRHADLDGLPAATSWIACGKPKPHSLQRSDASETTTGRTVSAASAASMRVPSSSTRSQHV